MYEAGLEQPGTMAAIIGLEAEAVEAVAEEASAAGIVVVANYNSPSQFAVSGEVAAVERAIEVAKKAGAKRALRLQVSGAFHSPLMQTTAKVLTRYMEKFERGPLRVPWIANVTGAPVESEGEISSDSSPDSSRRPCSGSGACRRWSGFTPSRSWRSGLARCWPA
jgi:[acyl-carrier-protein] S-malonyltransferase